jgi:hypothetical protein
MLDTGIEVHPRHDIARQVTAHELAKGHMNYRKDIALG